MIRALILSALIAAQSASPSGWKVEASKDAMTDHGQARALLINPDSALILSCLEGSPPYQIFIQPDAYLGGKINGYDLRHAYLRFDDEAPKLESWKYHDRYATPYDDNANQAFLNKARYAHRLRVRLVAYDERFVDLEFNLEGIGDALSQTDKPCRL